MIEIEAIDWTLPEEEIVTKIMQNLQGTHGFFAIKNVEGFSQAELHEAVRAFWEDIPPEEHVKITQKEFNRESESYTLGLIP